MTRTLTTFTMDDELATEARGLGVNVSAASRDGVAAAVRAARTARDRDAYRRHPEAVDDFWLEAEAWSAE